MLEEIKDIIFQKNDNEENDVATETVEYDDILDMPINYEQTLLERKDWEYIPEMAGRVPGLAEVPKQQGFIICVGDGERDIRHFHIFRNNNDKIAWMNGACLFFSENSYYDHGKNRATLSDDELKAVVKKLKEPHPTLEVTNWKYLITLWNDNNPEYPLEGNPEIPEYDYKTIKRYDDTKKEKGKK